MKNWIVTFLVLPLVLVACAEKKNDSQQVATVPPPATNCIDGTTYCNSNLYRQNTGYGAYPGNPYYYTPGVAWNSGFGGGGYYGNFCNCPYGSRPVYNGQYGLGCVSSTQFNRVSYGAVYWGWGADNNQWVNIPQVSNTQSYPTGNNSCFQNVAQSCFVNQPGSCGSGATCQTTGAGSHLGICVAIGANGTTGGTISGYR